jgi:hypothetical protein
LLPTPVPAPSPVSGNDDHNDNDDHNNGGHSDNGNGNYKKGKNNGQSRHPLTLPAPAIDRTQRSTLPPVSSVLKFSSHER